MELEEGGVVGAVVVLVVVVEVVPVGELMLCDGAAEAGRRRRRWWWLEEAGNQAKPEERTAGDKGGGGEQPMTAAESAQDRNSRRQTRGAIGIGSAGTRWLAPQGFRSVFPESLQRSRSVLAAFSQWPFAPGGRRWWRWPGMMQGRDTVHPSGAAVIRLREAGGFGHGTMQTSQPTLRCCCC